MGTKEKILSKRYGQDKADQNEAREKQQCWKHIQKLRSRIQKILDEQFYWMSKMVVKQNYMRSLIRGLSVQSQLMINESKLEQWVEMFRHQILTIKPLKKVQKRNKIEDILPQNIPLLDFPKPSHQKDSDRIFYLLEANKVKIFQPDEYKQSDQRGYYRDFNQADEYRQRNKEQKSFEWTWKQIEYDFPEGTIKRFSSMTYLSGTQQIMVVGGSKPKNPNIKSSKILSLNLKTAELKTLSNLPYGLSSHSALLDSERQSIYIIGGNKNYSIVTRGCFRIDLTNMNVQEMSCLNYPVSSATCILWKQNWIYKFGGIGEAFGDWDTSPYIQRYSISDNQWELINPSIKQQIQPDLIFQNIFLAGSASYLCHDPDKIFVFGGYSIEGQFMNYGFVLKIIQTQQNLSNDQKQEETEKHTIQQFGQTTINDIKLASNKILFTKGRSGQMDMFGLDLNLDTNQINPRLIHKFSLN